MSEPLTHLATVGLMWAAVAHRTPSLLQRPSDPALRMHLLALALMAGSATVIAPPIYVRLAQASGLPHIGHLLADGLLLVSVCCAQHFTAQLERDGPGRNAPGWCRPWCLGVVLALAATCFGLAHLEDGALAEAAPTFTSQYADRAFFFEYRALVLAYLALSATHLARQGWSFSKRTGRSVIRLGLRLMAVGYLVFMAYLVNESTYLVAHRVGAPYPVDNPDPTSQALLATSFGPLFVGLALLSLGRSIETGARGLAEWTARYRSYRRLRPLWLALCGASPSIALSPPESVVREALAVRGLRFRLYRRVVEIWDGRLALRPFLDPAVADHALRLCRESGVPPGEAALVAEAALLGAALHAKTDGRPMSPSMSLPTPPAAGGLDAEAAVLGRVAEYLQTSAIVKNAVALADADRCRLRGSGSSSAPRPGVPSWR